MLMSLQEEGHEGLQKNIFVSFCGADEEEGVSECEHTSEDVGSGGLAPDVCAGGSFDGEVVRHFCNLGLFQ